MLSPEILKALSDMAEAKLNDGDQPSSGPPDVKAPQSTPLPPARDDGFNDVVRQYIIKQLQPKQEDPGLQRALDQQRIQKIFGDGHENMGLADSMRTAHGLPAMAKAEPAQEDPVKQYLDLKRHSNDEVAGNIGNADKLAQLQERLSKANNLNQMQDPNSIARLKAETAAKESQRKTDQGDRGLDLKDKHEGFYEWLKKEELPIEEKRALALQARSGVSSDRLNFAISKYNNDMAGKVTPGIEYNSPASVDKKTATTNSDLLASVNQLDDTIGDFKKLRDPTWGYGNLPVSQKRALLDALQSHILPLATKTGGFGNFTLAHQHLAEKLAPSADSPTTMLNADAVDAMLDNLSKEGHGFLQHKVDTTPGGGGGKVTNSKRAQPSGAYSRKTGTVDNQKYVTTKSINGKTYGKDMNGDWHEVAGGP